MRHHFTAVKLHQLGTAHLIRYALSNGLSHNADIQTALDQLGAAHLIRCTHSNGLSHNADIQTALDQLGTEQVDSLRSFKWSFPQCFRRAFSACL